MKFDDFLEDIGGFGRYQILQTTLAQALVIPLAFQLFTLPIISASPNFRCKTGPVNESDDIFSPTNISNHRLVNATIPRDDDGLVSQCKIYVYNETDGEGSGNRIESKCTEWVFDRSVFKSSVMEDLGLVCDKYFLKSTTEAAFMGGGLIGSLIFAWMYDIYGRKKITLLAITILGVFGVISAWISDPYLLIFVRLICGMGDAVTYMGIVLMCIEVVSPDKRNMVNHCTAIAYALAACLLLTFAPFVESWRVLETLVSCVALAIAIIWFWILDESPRWLLSVGKDEDAEIIMRKMARMNGHKYPEDLIQRLETEYHETQGHWTDVFRGGRMVVMTLILCFNWFTVAFIYYGLAMGMDALRTNFFLVLALSCLVEVPGHSLSWFLSDRIGRKKTYSVLIFMSSFALIGTIFPVLFGDESHMWITITLTLMGKCFGSGAYACITLYTPELYPTTMRSTASAVPGFISRIGSFIVPYVSDLGILIPGDISRVFHLLLFGVFALVAAILNLQLSETMRTQLPDTVAHLTEARRISLEMDEIPHQSRSSITDE